jgi:DNA-binding response OmpR family regulator
MLGVRVVVLRRLRTIRSRIQRDGRAQRHLVFGVSSRRKPGARASIPPQGDAANPTDLAGAADAAGPAGPAEIAAPCWSDPSILRHADLALDPRTRQVRRGDRPIELTRTEFDLLELFLRNPLVVLTRDVIFDRVWGYGYVWTSNTLNVHVGYVRRKLEAGGEPRLIQTVRGVGYVLREESPGP